MVDNPKIMNSFGVYSIPEAAKLADVPARSIRRWLFGYDHTHQTKTGKKLGHSKPLWSAQYQSETFACQALGFRDLMEIRFVAAFVKAGVPLVVIRECLEIAREQFGEYPLSAKRFLTDGETIYLDSLASHEHPLDLRRKQFAFDEIIRSSLYASIEYKASVAARWFPLGKAKKIVVLDPTVAAGKPTLVGSGVPTAALYGAFLAEGKSLASVSNIFELPKAQVEAAIEFEEKLAA